MLVILSDLHFTDGTSSNYAGDGESRQDLFNVVPEAFELFFSKISDTVIRKDGVKKATFVYAGDIFDLLRTYGWFNIDERERPWALPPLDNETCRHAREVLDRIVQHNEEALAWLSCSHEKFEQTWQAGCEIEHIYLPGNHDRLVNLDEACRSLVWERLLGKRDVAAVFGNRHLDHEHGTIVMHGHETDRYNCEFDHDGEPQYEDVPIGDPMTTMLFARAGNLADEQRIPDEAKRRFKDLDNVRPALVGIRYIRDTIDDFDIKQDVDNMMHRIVDGFESLPFYHDWVTRHDHLKLDEADKLKTVLRILKMMGTSVPSGLISLIDKGAGLLSHDACEELATNTLRGGLGEDMRYCVMGHTHNPEHVPLYLDREMNCEKHYLNTGTFRTTFAQTREGKDFLSLQRMSYVIIYAPGEVKRAYAEPLYEMWSGLRKRY